MAMLTPADEAETRRALTTAYRHDGPVAVRYPRGSGVGTAAGSDFETLPWGRGEVRRESGLVAGRPGGQRIALLAFGTVLYPALAAADRLDATVANMRFVKPLDTALVEELARTHDALVTVEEGCVMGGAGSAVAEHLNAVGLTVPMLHLGLPDTFVEHGDPALLLAQCGLDAAGIEASVQKRFVQVPAELVRSQPDRNPHACPL
jgi:1-deoxy-D-xylulose-5-phosphate synthase